MFRNDVTQEDRKGALALRIDAGRFDPESLPAEGDRRRLAVLLETAPAWLLAELSRGMFKPAQRTGNPEIASCLIAFAEGLGLTPMSYALSRIDLKTAILCRLDRVADVTGALSLLETRLADEKAYQESLSPADLKRRRDRLKFEAEQPFTLLDAMKQRDEVRSEADRKQSAAFDPAAAFQSADAGPGDGGIVIRRMGGKQIREISRAWQDGWKDMSAENALSKNVTGPQGRWDFAKRLDANNRLFGIFEDGRLVGSMAVSPASANEAELGWFVLPEERGRGVASRAAAAAMDKLAAIGVERFGARARTLNPASIRVMEKLGFRPVEGHVATGTDIDWVSMTAVPGRQEDREDRTAAFAR